METRNRNPRGLPSGAVAAGLTLLAGLGLVALMATPRVATSPPETREAQRLALLSARLAELRGAIDTYWTRHDGFPGPTADDLRAQLMERTDSHGEVGLGPRFGLGPYLSPVSGGRIELPSNPLNGRADVTVVEALPRAADGTSGWIYCRLTGELRANATGATPDGTRLFDL